MNVFSKGFLIALVGTCFAGSLPARGADEHAEQPPRLKWSFGGPFGKFDRAQLQRGFRLYNEVCKGCHSLSLISFRNLAEPGGPEFTPAQAAEVAKSYKVKGEPNEQGEVGERDGRPADRFPPPYANEQAARAANGGSLPPDLSVMAKARTYQRGFPWFLVDMFIMYQEHGVDYISALLKGYEETPPQGVTIPPRTYYNKYFPDHAIGMPKPLTDGQVEYTDGTPSTLENYSRDVAAFLMWAAEPKLEERKRIGLQVMIFLIVLAALLYFTKKRVWHDVHHHPEKLDHRPLGAEEYNEPDFPVPGGSAAPPRA